VEHIPNMKKVADGGVPVDDIPKIALALPSCT
jgi:hypothetical protein